MAVLVGQSVRLRPTVADDRDALVAIRRTPEVMARWMGDDLEAEFVADLLDDEVTRFTVELLAGNRIIGLVQYEEETDPDYRSASIDIYLDPGVHGRGLGTDTVRTVVRHLIDDRGHHRLTIDPAADNAAAIACYAKVGFRPVGVLRQYERHGDTWVDGLLMDLVATDLD